MHALNLTILNLNFHNFTGIIFACLVLMAVLLIFIGTAALYKTRSERNKKIWEETIAITISRAIFHTNDHDEPVDIPYSTQQLVQHPAFKNYIIEELIQAKKNLSGVSTVNLKNVYEVLGLNNYSFSKLNSKKWHLKAKGIQELAIFDQKKYVKQIFRLTNNTNELVRNEAQCALLNYYGYLGLRFLNVTVHPISCWQQVQLLNLLREVKPQNSDALKKWLKSSNESVRVFALKLAANWNCYDAYEDVLDCLQSSSLPVRSSALEYLIKLPRENTGAHLIAHYNFGNNAYQVAIVDALKDMGSGNEINFLLKQLHNNDDDIKAAAAKSLALLHPSGISFLQTYLFADEDPWKAIFIHIANDRAA